jgi:hypothetical protein
MKMIILLMLLKTDKKTMIEKNENEKIKGMFLTKDLKKSMMS